MSRNTEGTAHLQHRNPAIHVVLLKEMVKHLVADLPAEDHERILRLIAKHTLVPGAWSSTNSTFADEDEAVLLYKIEQQLKALNKGEAIPRFNTLYRHLRRPDKSCLFQNRPGVLSFLLKVSEKVPREPTGESKAAQSANLGFLSQEDLKSKIFRNVPSAMQKGIINQSMPVNSTTSTVHRSASAEFPQTKRPTSLKTGNGPHLRHSTLLEEKPSLIKSKDRPSSSESLSLLANTPSRSACKGIVPESKVVKELLFCFQGIPGTLFKLDHQQGFSIDPMVKIPHEGLVVKILELGYLHNRITSQCRQLEKGGAVAQAIYCAIKKIMTEYYATIGCLDSELQQQSSSQSSTPDTPLSEDPVDPLGLGIFRLSILCREPLRTLKLLADVIKFALSGKGGGAAFSAIETLRHHGDTRYSEIVHKIVDQAGKPLVHMIIVWMVHGTLFDHYDEFFISVNSSCHDRDIWRDKFVLRSNLIPSVLSNSQAEMILRAGKGIHFLNVIREVRLPVEGLRKKLHRMKTCNIIDFADPRSEMCGMLSGVVEETSKLVLDVLVNEFKLFQHFHGLRRYILLGQGDFASYFLELMEPEMRKEASRLQYHELMSLLGTAIRGSTAAHDDPQILKRVTVKVLEASGGDWGSDVFSLQYIMNDPLDAAFKVSGGAYTLMFNFLWRTKRMEHVLLLLRKQRWELKNQLTWVGQRVPEVNGVLMFADLMAQEFLHFARQFHYYILFEVVECSWDKFCQDFKRARSFDDVIRAHEEFISEMQKRTFQKTENPRERYPSLEFLEPKTFINELRLIWDLVFEVENLQHRFFTRMMKEWDYLKNRETALDSGAGTSHKQEEEYQNKRKEFKCFLNSIKAQYNIIHRNYQDFIKKFLLDLSQQKDHELRLLSGRIDYNEHYKRTDSRLNESMKFSRCSDFMFN